LQAFQQLINNHKLDNREELDLVASLGLPPQQDWLRLLYRSKCKKYEQASNVEATLGEFQPTAESKAGQGTRVCITVLGSAAEEGSSVFN
jgi:hypothetical protein